MATKITGNESAFPLPKQVIGTGEDYHEIPRETGLTILQYYTGLAMQSLLNKAEDRDWTHEKNFEELDMISESAVHIAQDLIASLNAHSDDR